LARHLRSGRGARWYRPRPRGGKSLVIKRPTILALALSATTVSAQSGGQPRTAAETDAIRQAVFERIERGSDPVADAASAAQSGNFGLIAEGRFQSRPVGITCLTPYGQPYNMLAHVFSGDAIDERVGKVLHYAEQYNRALVSRPDYPDAELCRVSTDADHRERRSNFAITSPAQIVIGPPKTLHEAARRGSAADVRRLLISANLNSFDGVGMTPLAWAIGRNNAAAVDVLLDAGADPWAAEERWQTAVFWAARLGRRGYFEHMTALHPRPAEPWNAFYLAAAASGGSDAILARMLGEPHQRFRFEGLETLPTVSMAERILKDDPSLASALLWECTDYPADRADLVALALRHGADPDGVETGGRYGTPLGRFATGIATSSLESVNTLLEAGADPNKTSPPDRPVVIAIRSLKLDGKVDEFDERAMAVLDALLAAGADLNLPDDLGVPTSWRLLFPYYSEPETMDASYVTPSLIEALVTRGLDLNFQWQGKRMLPLVEAQAGSDSELATTLRRLGAQR